jgi:hypothetical protein
MVLLPLMIASNHEARACPVVVLAPSITTIVVTLSS